MATETVNNFSNYKYFTIDETLKATLDSIDSSNLRTTFKQASDPIYLAFRYVDNKSLARLAKEFVTDGANDIINYISKLFA